MDDKKIMKSVSTPSLNTNGGHDPMVPRKEKHSVKDSWWRQKKAKGDC